MNQKVLIIGLGSMGKRRIRNLRALKVKDIYGYDKNMKMSEAVFKEYNIKILDSLENLSKYNIDFAVICTPPQYHLEPVKICVKNKINFFMEFNLVAGDVATIVKELKKTKVLGVPSNTEFYDQDIVKLGRELAKKDAGYFIFHLGQNIHDWHPWQKAGEHFIFHPDTNGVRELLRTELPWLTNLFGEIKSFKAKDKSFYTKKFNVKDFICLQLEFKKNIQGVIIFDLISPVVVKKFTMVDGEGMVVWDERNNILEKIDSSGKKQVINLRDKKVWGNYKFHEDAHLSEMKQAMDIFAGKKEISYTFQDEIRLLKLIDGIEKNS